MADPIDETFERLRDLHRQLGVMLDEEKKVGPMLSVVVCVHQIVDEMHDLTRGSKEPGMPRRRW